MGSLASQLEWVSSVKYLGIMLHHSLKWDDQVVYSVTKASRILNLLRRNMHGCSKEAKSLAYSSLVRPHLEFSCPVWNPHKLKNIDALEGVQRRAARWICASWNKTKLCWSKSYEEARLELGWPTLRQRRQFMVCCQMYKIVNNLDCLNFSDYFNSNPSSSTRSHYLSILCRHSRINVYRYSFFVNAVYYWNHLPVEVVSSSSFVSFRNKLKSFIFQ